ncbi:MAG: helix-turn-helix transcriptional regulator [Firmicutes bacterium]|nr:helix-turn-helix transcriptional regulator [Bacillota bacterium]
MRKDEIDFGGNIKKVRLKHKLTQAQFAEIIGKSQSTVYGYENNTIVPPFKVLVRISSLFNVSMNELMWGPKLEEPIHDINRLHLIYNEIFAEKDDE